MSELAVGDIFSLALSNGEVGHGFIADIHPQSRKTPTPYIAIFKPDANPMDTGKSFGPDHFLLVGWTMDALFHHKRWSVVGCSEKPDTLPRPHFQVGIDSVRYVTDFYGTPLRKASKAEVEFYDLQSFSAPIGFQNAYEAVLGLREWEERFDRLTIAHAMRQGMGPTSPRWKFWAST